MGKVFFNFSTDTQKGAEAAQATPFLWGYLNSYYRDRHLAGKLLIQNYMTVTARSHTLPYKQLKVDCNIDMIIHGDHSYSETLYK